MRIHPGRLTPLITAKNAVVGRSAREGLRRRDIVDSSEHSIRGADQRMSRAGQAQKRALLLVCLQASISWFRCAKCGKGATNSTCWPGVSPALACWTACRLVKILGKTVTLQQTLSFCIRAKQLFFRACQGVSTTRKYRRWQPPRCALNARLAWDGTFRRRSGFGDTTWGGCLMNLMTLERSASLAKCWPSRSLGQDQPKQDHQY